MQKLISSIHNSKIKDLLKLKQKKYRDQTNLFIVEGFHLVEEAKNVQIVKEIFTSSKDIEGTLVKQEIINKFSTTKTPQPVIAICKKIEKRTLGNRVLVLNNLQDPGNVGTLIRTAHAFGWDDVIVQGVDIYSPKVLRSSQGSIFHINVFNENNIIKYFSGYKVYGAVLDKDAISYKNINIMKKIILILGNEGNGIEQNILKKIDTKVYIPIKFESLNVAIAGGILLSNF